jgi:uncharacterized protein
VNYLIFETQNNNRYLKSFNKNSIMLIHPAFGLKGESGNDITFSETEKDFQKAKEKYFEKHGYFKHIDLKNQINGKLRVEAISEFLPSIDHICFEITEKCNLNCRYCVYEGIYDGRRERKNNDIKLSTIVSLLDYFNNLFKYKPRNKPITISFYGGEPLLRIEIIEKTVSYIKKSNFNNMEVEYRMTTNGILLWKHINYLIENDFKLLVSLDGKSEHNSNRVFRRNNKPTFDVLKKNIDLIKMEYPEFYEKNISFNSVFNKMSDFDSIYDYFQSEFKKIPKFTSLDYHNVNEKKETEFVDLYKNLFESYKSSKHYKYFNKKFGDLSYEYISMGKFIKSQKFNYVIKDRYNIFFQPKSNLIPTGTCLPFKKKVFITSDGLILPCERIPHNHRLGFISDGVVSIDSVKIVKYYNSLYEKIVKQCNNCYNFENCDLCLLTSHRFSKCESRANKLRYSDMLSVFLNYIESYPNSYFHNLKGVSYDE